MNKNSKKHEIEFVFERFIIFMISGQVTNQNIAKRANYDSEIKLNKYHLV